MVRLRLMVQDDLLERAQSWCKLLSEQPKHTMHHHAGVTLTYAIRTACLIGLTEIEAGLKVEASEAGLSRLYMTAPRWFFDHVDEVAQKHKVTRNDVLRLALDLGLPKK